MEAIATLTSLASPVENELSQVLFRVEPPPVSERLPGDICVAVDVSGSMQLEATITGGQEVEVPLSILDIVKHAVKTLAHVMKAGDRLGIVAYSDDASIVLPLTEMSEAGHAIADAAVEGMNANGQTNMWAGISKGLDMLSSNARPNASSALMVLTDGIPNVEPAGGHLEALASYRTLHGGKLPCTVHTFGFGSDLDSYLLNSIACAGDGMYVFIPDAGFVGTALVNCMSNCLVTMGRNASISIEAGPGCEVAQCLGHRLERGSISLGSLQFGQSKDAVLQVKAPAGFQGPFVRARLNYDGPRGQLQVQDSSNGMMSTSAADLAEIKVQEVRLKFAELIAEIVSSVTRDGSNVAQVSEGVSRFDEISNSISDSRILALKEDIKGQVREATSRADWYSKWGLHYLQSLARAHLTQQCNNFKDPGVQTYGGELFNKERDIADDVFVSLPPPEVSNRAAIDMLCAMGFAEAEARRALAAANDNAELAAQYLFEGIPAAPARRAPTGTRSSNPGRVDMAAFYDRSAG